MPNSKIILTKTSRPNATPHPNDLDFGELAINYADGLLFFKNSTGRISKIASSGSFTTLTKHVANRENPHNVNKAQILLGNVDNTSDLDKEISISTQAALNKKADSDHLTLNYYNKSATDTQIRDKFNTIDVIIKSPTSSSDPAGSLSYTSGSTSFIYTQPKIPTLVDLGGVSISGISIQQLTSGSGTLSYGGSGIFTYNKPTIEGLGGYAKTEIGLTQKTADRSFDGTLTYNDGFFTYDKPTIAGITNNKITLVGGEIVIDGFVTADELDATNLQGQITANDVDITALQNKDSAQDDIINDKVTNLGAVTGIQQLTQQAYEDLVAAAAIGASTVYIIVD